jgi:hypothetical protein
MPPTYETMQQCCETGLFYTYAQIKAVRQLIKDHSVHVNNNVAAAGLCQWI